MQKHLLVLTIVVLIGVVFTVDASAQVQPDLIVKELSITKDGTGQFVDKVTVGVSNACGQSRSGVAYVLVTFKQSSAKDAKPIYYIGNTVRALRGGEIQYQTFDVSEKKIGGGSYVYAEADPYKKVTEADEGNNWRTLNPTAAGALLTQSQCMPKN